MKVVVKKRLRPGQAVKIEFAPPDGGPPIDVVSLVVRVDPEGAAFWFLDFRAHEPPPPTSPLPLPPGAGFTVWPVSRDGLLIGEIAKRSGASRKALRLYEAAGILPA